MLVEKVPIHTKPRALGDERKEPVKLRLSAHFAERLFIFWVEWRKTAE
ncbi:hypothetical protein SD77_3320 [Bacillus badius]|uniref:Uncharacterized protein n=1 Tax=Bacillus badius TaxID=1455 RepID=A0ABR5AXI7_BACBA|nr:hypothetical protein SD78_0088 [Bacillus badius]KIL79454.1 hypothetical protein SD77_3320 [Bacillus badius]